MPVVTYLSDQEARDWATVKDDKECNDLLQEVRAASGKNWVISINLIQPRKHFFGRLKPAIKDYTLYADCHGEWQIINLVTPNGGSVFHASTQSREDVMNFMCGILCGLNNSGF